MLSASITCLFASVVYAQITTNEQPIGLSQTQSINVLRSGTPTQTLVAPNMAIINAEDAIADEQSQPLRFAYPIQVNYTLGNSGRWQNLTNGDKLWQLKVQLQGALSSNAFYDKFYLPKGAKFFVYNEKTGQSIGAITSEFLSSTFANPKEFATGLVYGETVVFEYWQPANTQDSAVISISRIDYGYRNINNAYSVSTRSFGDADDCNININCSEGNNWQAEKRAIARMLIMTTQGSGWCSCALVNNTNNDNTPYVLTANHCLSGLDAINNNNASQWIFYWGYEHSGCNNSNVEPIHKSTTGATLVANNSISDFALLQLTQDPRNLSGFIPYYLGWDRTGNVEIGGGIGIHHPRGDVKKISIANQIQNSGQINWADGTTTLANTHWSANYIKGTTEGGSSGSPLINSSHRVIGQLHGGSVGCAPITKYYGKFNVSWTGNNATDNRRKLQPWLDPAGTNLSIVSGKNLVSISGSSSFCPRSTATFTVSNAPAGYTWGCSSNLTPVAGSPGSFTTPSTLTYPPTSTWVSISYNGVELARKHIEPAAVSLVAPVYINAPSIYQLRAISDCDYNYTWTLTNRTSSFFTFPDLSTPQEFSGTSSIPLAASLDKSGRTHNYTLELMADELRVGISNYDNIKYTLSLIGFKPDPNFAFAYPNPAATTLRVEMNEEATSAIRLQTLSRNHRAAAYRAQLISTITGAVVLDQAVSGDSFDLDVSGVLNGSYTLVLSQNGSKVWSSHVIVQH
jgi:hypothetical protein